MRNKIILAGLVGFGLCAGASAQGVGAASIMAVQLVAPYFTSDSRLASRFYILNTSSAAISYSTTCYSQPATAITYGLARTGSLLASRLTVINASSICTFAGNAPGSIVFTVDGPVGSIKATHEALDPVSLRTVVTPLTRPYEAQKTSE